MLDIAKMDAQKLDVQLRLGDPVQFIGQCVEGFANLANQRRIDLTFNTFIPDETLRSAESVRVGAAEQTYPFDDDKLGKIMYNLLSNALKFTPEGGSVRVSGGLTTDRQLLIRVQDTGIGIAADHLNRIFDRFYQADASTTRRYEGTGIGLAYIRELTELLGGQVTVESVLGMGTTFTVTLPMLVTTAGVNRINPASPTTPPLISQPLPPPARAGAVITAPAADQPLVLLVEDNEELRAYMADQLRQDYQVQEAVDGRDGITQALAAIPDLIVSDVMMPYVDGYALVETLKNDERTSHIPIVVLTAKSSFESRMQGLYAGADDYLSKPFSFAELNTRIQNVLHTRQKWQHYLVATQTAAAQETTSVPLVGQMISGREEQFLTRLRQLILANLTDKVVDVDWLVEQARMSRTQLHRKLTALTNQSTTGFIHSVRLGKAQELLQMDEDELTIAEVAYRVGYTSPAYFSKMFNEHFGHPPTRLRG
jgi:DNA-binding response OmpR family regulator